MDDIIKGENGHYVKYENLSLRMVIEYISHLKKTFVLFYVFLWCWNILDADFTLPHHSHIVGERNLLSRWREWRLALVNKAKWIVQWWRPSWFICWQLSGQRRMDRQMRWMLTKNSNELWWTDPKAMICRSHRDCSVWCVYLLNSRILRSRINILSYK